MKKKMSILLLLLTIFLGGCSQKLADKQNSFEGKGMSFEFQLPSRWEPTHDFKSAYKEQAVFGAADKKSNSSVFITIERKENVELENFGETMREEVALLFGYKKAKDVYMNSFELNGKKSYRYTVQTRIDNKKVWLHLYYVETESGMVRFDFYSANDGNHEKRVKIIDESVLSLKEIDDSGAESQEEDEIAFENDSVALKLVGIMQLEAKDNKQLVVLRHTITNKGSEPISADYWEQQIQVKQNGQVLEKGQLPEENTQLNLAKLVKQKQENLSTGQTIDTISLYELKDTSNIELSPSKETFSETKSVYVTLTNEETEGGN